MSMGIVSNEELELEISRLNGKIETGVISELPAKGRGNGNLEIPESLKKIIGETSIEEGRQSSLKVARAFGISDSSVSAYSVGSTSTGSYHNPSKNLQSHLNRVKEKIQKKARLRLSSALDSITPEKLQEANLREASGVARDMSVIIKNLEPASERSQSDGPQFVICAPQIREERSFEVINVNE